MNPRDLESFRAALLEGDRRLVRRRRQRVAGGAAGIVAAVLLVVTLIPNSVDATAVAAEARKELLSHQGLVLHSETEVVLPDGRVQQRISRWSLGDRSRTVSVAGGRRVEQAVDGRVVRVHMGDRIDTLRSAVPSPDPLLEYRKVLDRATAVEDVEVGGVDAYRLAIPRQVAYIARATRLPLRVELQGGVTLRYRVVEWLPERDAQLDLK